MISGENYAPLSRRLVRPQKTEYKKENMLYKPEFVRAFQKCKEIENRLVTFRVIEF